MIQVSIVEDDRDIRNGMQKYLNDQGSMKCQSSHETVESLLTSLEAKNLPNVVLMDIELPGMTGIEGMRVIKQKYPQVDIMMFTIYHDAEKIFQSLCAGASGYLLKNTPLTEVKESIELLVAGGAPMSPQIARKVIEYFNPKKSPLESPLTPTEKRVVQSLVEGLSYKMIADVMNISMETVRFHIKNIYKKLHVHSRATAVRVALERKLV